jgi:regulation of enolase protein 1 (concanavalin A-like superfamily)
MKHRIFAASLLILASPPWLAAADSASLPEPWKHEDIGSARVGMPVPPVPADKFGKNGLFGKSGTIAGSAKQADGVFSLQGTMDIWGPMDGGHFVWQPIQGDFVFIARVTSMDNPGKVAHAKAGLCIRESIDGGSPRVAQCITAVDGTQFLYREKDGKTIRDKPAADAAKPSVPKEKFPCWLKLVRQGNVFTGYESLDGQTWWPTGTIKLDLKADALIGLSSSSHATDALTTSVFDHVTLTRTSK